MESKPIRWIVLIISIILMVGAVLIIIRDVSFFITKREASGKILSIDSLSSGYRIKLSYFSNYKAREVVTTIKFKSSYKEKVENLGNAVTVYYSKIFPKHVYIKEFNVPKKGIIVFEIIFILLLYLAARFGFDGVRRPPLS